MMVGAILPARLGGTRHGAIVTLQTAKGTAKRKWL
jgi:hypothetical protein